MKMNSLSLVEITNDPQIDDTRRNGFWFLEILTETIIYTYVGYAHCVAAVAVAATIDYTALHKTIHCAMCIQRHISRISCMHRIIGLECMFRVSS